MTLKPSAPPQTGSERMKLLCFQKRDFFGPCCRADVTITIEDVLRQVTWGGVECPLCRKTRNLREEFHVPVFGMAEALFGLDSWSMMVGLPASTQSQVYKIDTPSNLPPGFGLLAYANITILGSVEFDQLPMLLAPQNMHQPWSFPLRLYIPPGPERHVNVIYVGRATTLELPRQLALQAVSSFHRAELNVASVLLGASIEASLRERLKVAYAGRSVKLPEDLGFGQLLERARMMLDPKIGEQMTGNLKELASKGRNPSAHGSGESVTLQQVASWMVDAAVMFEWSRYATEVWSPKAT
jgi:hypothetical protein